MAVYATSYELFIDWNDDGDFGDTNEDCSANLMNTTISRGYTRPLARVPQVGRATFVLDNESQTYNPATNADARPRREVQFDMTYGGTTETLFYGYIETIRPMMGQYGEKRCTIECVDAMALLDLYQGSVAFQTNVHADDIIGSVVSAVYTPPSTNYQTGLNVFPTSGDRWAFEPVLPQGSFEGYGAFEETRASQKILAACTADWGRFFIAGDGEATFFNRHQMPTDATTELTLSNLQMSGSYSMGASETYNHVEVTCHPRSIGTSLEVIGRLSQRQAPGVDAGATRTFKLQFRDPSNQAQRIGGTGPISGAGRDPPLTPVATIDYVMSSDPEGNADDETANVDVTMTAYSDHADVTVDNARAGHAVYVQKLNVRGYAVRSREPVTMVATDGTSDDSYQSRNLRFNCSLMSNPADAEGLAAYLLDYYKDPLDSIQGVTFCANRNATLIAAARDLELMDKVVLTETQTGVSSWTGHIYWLHHAISDAGRLHLVTMNLEEPYTLSGTPFRYGSSTFAPTGTHVFVY